MATYSKEYGAALEAHSIAQAAYLEAVKAFRISRDGNAYEVFAAAQAAKKTADGAFDEAFNAESERSSN